MDQALLLPPLERLVNREEWGATPQPADRQPLKTPVSYLRLFNYTNTESCLTSEECVKMVQSIQKRDIEDLGFDDIRYNFLIGEDGNIYEGRGWHTNPPKEEKCRLYEGNYLEIALIGEHRRTPREDPIFETAGSLIKWGIDNKMIKYEFLPLYEE